MNNEQIKETSRELNKLCIKYDVAKDGIMINRDSICQMIEGITENDCYTNLINDYLKPRLGFDKRFFYATRTDDWMFLDIMP